MQPTWKTTDRIWPEGVRPVGIAESGEVRAFVWECAGEYGMHLYREDPDSGRDEPLNRVGDLEHLARVLAVVANAVHQIAESADSCRNLGVLAARLGQALEVSTDADRRPDHEAMQ